ncbi:hypothetical protein GF359_00770 [candidate division WOR-3 bacterium]|uniref:RHS repeat protein n=1 Tax=candidate division WOR-3 bacterium TaxID=2052148 RepID=A0A9D5K985_UNCW3|nr:hypothetical protein [candidate division WOR-3 bacterium]
MAQEAKELEARIEELREERSKFQEKVEGHLKEARTAAADELIEKAEQELQSELMNRLNAAVSNGNEELATKLLDGLKSYYSGKIKPGAKTDSSEPPSVSPAIAAKKSTSKPQEPKPQPPSQRPTAEKKAPPPPPSSSKPSGKIIERRTMLNDSLNEICRYEYSDGQLTKMIFLDSEGNPLRTHQMVYDKDGNLEKEIHVDQAGRTLQVLERETSKSGKIVKEIIKNADDELLNSVEFDYDNQGRLNKKEWFDAKAKRTKVWEYEYEKSNKDPLRIIWRDERNKPYGQVELKYDEKGNITKEISKDRTGDVIRSINYHYFYG